MNTFHWKELQPVDVALLTEVRCILFGLFYLVYYQEIEFT